MGLFLNQEWRVWSIKQKGGWGESSFNKEMKTSNGQTCQYSPCLKMSQKVGRGKKMSQKDSTTL